MFVTSTTNHEKATFSGQGKLQHLKTYSRCKMA